MKHLLLVISLSMFAFSAVSQLSDQALDSLKKIWKVDLEQQVLDKGIGQYDKEYSNTFADSIFAQFQIDTFIVEGIYGFQLEVDMTTYGLNRASKDCEAGYDVLLNKYYTIFLKKLNNEDRKQLIEAQRAWLKFRDAEREVNSSLVKSEYSGGGTIHQLIHSSQNLYITKMRVVELVGYLMRMQ